MRYITMAAIAASLVLSWQPVKAADTFAALGTVQHVSTDNIKIYVWQEQKTESFIIIPQFKNLFSKDGKTTYQMADLAPGMDVDIHYSTALGIRHATQIYVLDPHGHVLHEVKG